MSEDDKKQWSPPERQTPQFAKEVGDTKSSVFSNLHPKRFLNILIILNAHKEKYEHDQNYIKRQQAKKKFINKTDVAPKGLTKNIIIRELSKRENLQSDIRESEVNPIFEKMEFEELIDVDKGSRFKTYSLSKKGKTICDEILEQQNGILKPFWDYFNLSG